MSFKAVAITLTRVERAGLEHMRRPLTGPAGDVFRVPLGLLLYDEHLRCQPVQDRRDSTTQTTPPARTPIRGARTARPLGGAAWRTEELVECCPAARQGSNSPGANRDPHSRSE